jgi:Flp pilus assembly protein CpaB
MKPKTMILLVVAVSCGLVASYMTSKLLAERKGPVPDETVQVVVATTKVPRFTHLKEPEKYFVVKEFRKSDAPKSYISRLEDIKDKRLNKDFKPDVHISPEDVQDRATTALPIPDGYGAIGIKVTAASAVSYFVNPGDKVDVILTQRGDQAAAYTILRDVQVLSVEDRITRAEAESKTEGSTIKAQTVALAVKPDDAKRVRFAESVGDLSLVLRKDGDKLDASDKIITLDDLRRPSQVARTEPLPTVPTPPTPTTTPTPPVVQPDNKEKLPFGLTTEEIKKAEKKEPVVEVKVEPIKPFHRLKIEAGTSPAQVVNYYQLPDGSISRDPNFEAKKEEKK